MALIKQIKVGGTTYDIGVNVGSGLTINSGIAILVSSGIRVDSSGLSVLISGHADGYLHGLKYENNEIAIKLASGLMFNSKGEIALNLGSGLSINPNGEIVTKEW